MKIFISGKVNGDDNYKQKFAKVESLLKSQGYTVINPTVIPEELDYDCAIKICIAMLECADAVYMLGDWKESKGAKLENYIATCLNKKIIYEVNDTTDFFPDLGNTTQCGVYNKIEEIKNCCVSVWENTLTNETFIGWRRMEDDVGFNQNMNIVDILGHWIDYMEYNELDEDDVCSIYELLKEAKAAIINLTGVEFDG